MRWLNVKNRTDEAMKILKKIAKTNKKELPDDVTLKAPDKEAKTSGNYIDFFRPKHVAINTVVQLYSA